MITVLEHRLWFPDPLSADAKGLVCIGGDFSTERLLLAYRSGVFPWTVKPITWWSPEPRAIFELQNFHVPHSAAKFLRKEPFRYSVNAAFPRVMRGCAAPARGRRSTWITPEFREAYGRLHAAGHAHSVEVWRDEKLVGGIYGVAIGGFFAGESMFHTATGASKAALCHLVERLRSAGYVLFDIQMSTPATEPFHPVEIPRIIYLARLRAALEAKPDSRIFPGVVG